MENELVWLSITLLFIALAYAAVGQAGATGYIAAMALFGIAPESMKITALALNLLVAAIASFQFMKSGRFLWMKIYPFAISGLPFAMLGGAVQLPVTVYYPLVGAILCVSAAQTVRSAFGTPPRDSAIREAPFWPALTTGAVVGFIAGTTGTGGGVFLAPLLLAMNWANLRQTASITAVCNLINSAAAMIGAYNSWSLLPAALPYWLIAVASGGTVGAVIGSRYLSERWLRVILATLLAASGVKMLWTS